MKKLVLLFAFFISIILSSCGNSKVEPTKAGSTHFVTFIVMGEEYGEARVVNNGKITLPDNPTFESYEFLGWYIGPEMESAFVNENIDKDLVVYAKFNFPEGGAPSETTTTS